MGQGATKFDSTDDLKGITLPPPKVDTALLPLGPKFAPNTMQSIIDEDYAFIDVAASSHIPQFVHKEIQNGIRVEGARACYEHEKVMARCCQDKFWTAWKCQRERDAYFKCLRDEERSGHAARMNAMRWKYTLGIYGGELLGRKKLMRQLWQESFPDREIPHSWANDD